MAIISCDYWLKALCIKGLG